MHDHEMTLSAPLWRSISPTRAWIWLACLSLVLATFYALAVVVFRLPFFVNTNPQLFRTALALHVELAVFVWLIATMAAQWAQTSAHHHDLLSPLLAALGTVLLASSPLFGGKPLMLDYFPILAKSELFETGFALICLGATIAAVNTLIDRPKHEALRLSAWSALMAVLTAMVTASRGTPSAATIAWAAGHTLLFTHVIMLCREWTIHTNASPATSRTSIRWLAVASTLMPLIALFDPAGTNGLPGIYTNAMSLLLWPPVLWLAWKIRRLRSPLPAAFESTVFRVSLALFVAGCLIGAFINAPTTLVTAHYHATMGAVAISRMGMSYRMYARRNAPGAARQIILYALGLTLLAGGLALAAVEGAPRKTAASELIVHGPWFVTGMSISGLGGILAMIGTGWWVYNLLGPQGDRQPQNRTPGIRR